MSESVKKRGQKYGRFTGDGKTGIKRKAASAENACGGKKQGAVLGGRET